MAVKKQMIRYMNLKIIDKLTYFLILPFLIRGRSSVDQTKIVFVLSSGRAGSTLLRKELMKNGVHIPPETYDFIRNISLVYASTFFCIWRYRCARFIKTFTKSVDFDQWSIKVEDIETALLDLPNHKRTIQGIIEVVNKLFNSGVSTEYWGDKTPFLILRINYLKALFPRANYIFLMRNFENTVTSRKLKLNESQLIAENRVLISRRIMSREIMKKYHQLYLMTYEYFTNQPEKVINNIFSQFRFSSKRPEGFIFLGDDKQSHHSDLHKKIQPSSYSLSVETKDLLYYSVLKKELSE